MDWSQVINPIAASGILGAIAGAALNQFFTVRRNRKQPVLAQKDVTSLFQSKAIDSKHSAYIIFPSTAEKVELNSKHVYLTTIRLKNTGNKDYQEFEFGVTTTDNTEIILADAVTKGNRHKVEYSKQVSPQDGTDDLGITLRPFNRKEEYEIKLHITNNQINATKESITIDTQLPIKLIEAETTRKLWLDTDYIFSLFIFTIIFFIFSSMYRRQLHDLNSTATEIIDGYREDLKQQELRYKDLLEENRMYQDMTIELRMKYDSSYVPPPPF